VFYNKYFLCILESENKCRYFLCRLTRSCVHHIVFAEDGKLRGALLWYLRMGLYSEQFSWKPVSW